MNFLIGTATDHPASAAADAPFRLAPNPDALPRVWIVHQYHRLQPLRQMNWSTLDRRTEQVFVAANGQPRNLRQEVVIETDVALPAVHHSASLPDNQQTAEACTVMEIKPTRIMIQVQLNQPGYLVLRDAFAPGWSCRSRTGVGPWVSRPVFRANRVMRGVALPAGQHELVFVYRPQTLLWGGLISLASWIGIGFMVKPTIPVLLRQAGRFFPNE